MAFKEKKTYEKLENKKKNGIKFFLIWFDTQTRCSALQCQSVINVFNVHMFSAQRARESRSCKSLSSTY